MILQLLRCVNAMIEPADYNWFWSSFAQSGAAITAILGGFLLSRIISFIAERHEFSRVLTDYTACENRLKDQYGGLSKDIAKYLDEHNFIINSRPYLGSEISNSLANFENPIKNPQKYVDDILQLFSKIEKAVEDTRKIIFDIQKYFNDAASIKPEKINEYLSTADKYGNPAICKALIAYAFEQSMVAHRNSKQPQSAFAGYQSFSINEVHWSEEIKKRINKYHNQQMQELISAFNEYSRLDLNKRTLIKEKPYLEEPQYFTGPFKYLLLLLLFSVVIPLIATIVLQTVSTAFRLRFTIVAGALSMTACGLIIYYFWVHIKRQIYLR